MEEEQKQLEILIIEDNPKHTEDAKAEMERLMSAGAPIKVEYAPNLREALGLISKKSMMELYQTYSSQQERMKKKQRKKLLVFLEKSMLAH